jgi:hypothetical protein
MSKPIDLRLGAAILDVLTSISHNNLTHGSTGSVNVPRSDINRLRDVFEEMYPGSIQRCRELQARPPLRGRRRNITTKEE